MDDERRNLERERCEAKRDREPVGRLADLARAVEAQDAAIARVMGELRAALASGSDDVTLAVSRALLDELEAACTPHARSIHAVATVPTYALRG